MALIAPERNPSLHLLRDHLDAALALGEDLLAAELVLAAPDQPGLRDWIRHTRSLDAFLGSLRTLEYAKDLRKQREASSSVSLTCFGGVSSELPFRALQVLGQHGIVPESYVLSPHSVSLFVPVENREAAVTALHSLVQQT